MMLLLVLAAMLTTSHAALVNTRYSLSLDIGQERGSWMPPVWGNSGARALATPVVQFAPEGKLRLLDNGAWDHLTVRWATDDDGAVGQWKVEGEKATFFFTHDGVERGDVVLDPGRIYCTAGAWGDMLQRRGTLTIKQRKFGWLPFLPAPREASFLVGTYTATAVTDEER